MSIEAKSDDTKRCFRVQVSIVLAYSDVENFRKTAPSPPLWLDQGSFPLKDTLSKSIDSPSLLFPCFDFPCLLKTLKFYLFVMLKSSGHIFALSTCSAAKPFSRVTSAVLGNEVAIG